MHIFYTYTFRSSCVILCSSFAVVDCQWRIHYFTFLIVLVCVITSLKRFICCALLLLFGYFLVTCCAIIAAFEWMLQTNLIFAVHCCCAYTFLPDSVQSEIKSPYWFGALAYVCVCGCVCVCWQESWKKLYNPCKFLRIKLPHLNLQLRLQHQLLTFYHLWTCHTNTRTYICILYVCV